MNKRHWRICEEDGRTNGLLHPPRTAVPRNTKNEYFE